MLNYISDDGHGWLEVSLKDYPLAQDHATGYGYLSLDGTKIYLEEDCEMTSFLRSIGCTGFDSSLIKEVRHYGSSVIRSFPHNSKQVSNA